MITIPAGMRVIFDDGVDLKDKVYILGEDIGLTLRSSFSPIVDGGAPKLLHMLAGVTNAVLNFSTSGEYKQLGFNLWESTDPLSIGFTVELIMRTDAKSDVFDPMQALIKLPLPDDKGGLQGLVPPGPSVLSLFGGDKITKYGSTLNVTVGGLTLENAILTSAEPTLCRFSDDHDYPIYAKIQCAVMSSQIATKGMISTMFVKHTG
jgi:hypothetical protein